jgi:DNA-binding transcriptional MerR regulator
MRHANISAIAAADRAETDDAARDAHDDAAAAGDTNAPADMPMTIGEVAREFGMTLRALRFYETKRLIAPERHGSIRLYRHNDRRRIALILTGRRLGFTLAEIKDLVGKFDDEALHLTREQCVEQINLLEQQKRGIEVAIAELRQIYTSFYKKLLDDGEPRRGSPGEARRRSSA